MNHTVIIRTALPFLSLILALSLYSCKENPIQSELLEETLIERSSNYVPGGFYTDFEHEKDYIGDSRSGTGTGSDFNVTYGFIKGVNIRNCFHKSNHPEGATEAQIIQRVAEVLDTLRVESIRLGGLISLGASYDDRFNGYGWSKYDAHPDVAYTHPTDNHANADGNYNRMALKAAKLADVSVWIDFHRYMNYGEIANIRHLIDSIGVRMEGITRANEPYVPHRADNMRDHYTELNKDRFGETWWPAMWIGPSTPSRWKRVDSCVVLVNEFRNYYQGIEAHIYYPKHLLGGPKTPTIYLDKTLQDTRDEYNTTKIMVGEWSGKNPDTFDPADRVQVINEFLVLFKQYGLKSYYQFLGGGDADAGLWNFVTDSPNVGAWEFRNFN